MSWFFVVGTDTGVGKTAVSVALLRAAQSQGLSTLGIKPAETGCGERGGELGGELAARRFGEDAVALAGASTVEDDEVGFLRLLRPASPRAAALAEGMTLSRSDLERAVLRRIALPVGLGIVEGAGGLLVPFGDDWDLADLVRAAGIPAVLVGRSGLGTINHTLLTLEVLAQRKISVAGFILSDGEAGCDPGFAAENRAEIVRISGARCLGHARRGEAGVELCGSPLAQLLGDSI